jgi:2-dehydropantoate 2-reductase
MMRWLVLGAGALGGLFGGRLLKGGADVTFMVRPGRAAQLARTGLVVRTQDGDIRTPVKALQQGEIDGTYDVILLCCKAYDLDSAMEAIAPAIGEDSAVLPLLNGVRHIDVLSDRFGAQRVLGGLTAINAALLPDGVIQQSQLRVSMNILGELDGRPTPRCRDIRAALVKGGIQADISDNVVASLWVKFFAFASIAAIASLTRSRAGVVTRSADGAAFVSAVLDECARIASAEGFPPAPDTPDIVRGMFSQPDSTYGPSILIDMEAGRPTEGEHTVGDMVDRATRCGVSAPILTAARCNLQAYEINRTKGT